MRTGSWAKQSEWESAYCSLGLCVHERKKERTTERKETNAEMIVHEQYENENEGKNKNLFWVRLVGFMAMDEDKNMFAGLNVCGTNMLWDNAIA